MFRRWIPALLLLFAFCYYGSYYRCSLYPAGEGGVEGVIALRLLEGKIPFIETILNYNLFWFYPIVALFKIVGPSYTTLRVFFFFLASLTGLLSFYILSLTTKRLGVATLAGVLTLILPGQLFRNYMAFLVILNMAVFLKAFLSSHSTSQKQWLWIGMAGLSLSLTFLIRIDLGFFLSIIFLGLSLLFPWIRFEKQDLIPLPRRLLFSVAALLIGALGFLTLHLPVYCYAIHRGFAAPFAAQYQQWPHMIITQANQLVHKIHFSSPWQKGTVKQVSSQNTPASPISSSLSSHNGVLTEPTAGNVEQGANNAQQRSVHEHTRAASTGATQLYAPAVGLCKNSNEKTTLVRASLTSLNLREKITALNLYLPIITSFLMILMAIGFFFKKRRQTYFCHRSLTRIFHHSRDEKAAKADGARQTQNFDQGCMSPYCPDQNSSLTQQPSDFPAFAVERDERSGLILFSSLGCSLTLFPQYFFWRPDMVHLSEFMVPMTVTILISIVFAIEAWSYSKNLLKFFLFLFLTTAITTLTLYFINGCQSQSTGGIAISEGRTKEFFGKNGVHVKLKPHEWEEASAIYQSILQHSKEGDYVVCFPYNPEINFMTNRPSYRRDLYCDDVTAAADFDKVAIGEIETFHPAVIVITNWPINGTEHSRFSNWAAKTYSYIQSHYRLDYSKGIIEVFICP